jgi:hypothetical protein
MAQSRYFGTAAKQAPGHRVGEGEQRWYRAAFLNHALATS